MKKHLHGKRHMIARRSVAVGRDNKRIRKLNRFIRMTKRLDWGRLFKDVAITISDLAVHVASAMNSLRRMIAESVSSIGDKLNQGYEAQFGTATNLSMLTLDEFEKTLEELGGSRSTQS